MSRCVAALAILFLQLARAGDWTDPSPHTIRFIEVESGVKLELLDWGGSGEPLLLLAGHGDTGHIFDDFAPALTDRFRVFALTRRGFGASSQPASGYDLATMARDIDRVREALKLSRIHLAGHSIAGDEMTRFARTFPARTGKLIYLDAAYDRVEAQRLEKQFPRLPSLPDPPSPTPQSLRAFIAATDVAMPEAEIRAVNVFGPDGRLAHTVTPPQIVSAVATMVEHPDYASIRAPMLAIYAVYTSPEQLAPRYTRADAPTQHTLETIFDMWRTFAAAQRATFRAAVPTAKIIELPGANHYVFISNRARVLSEMRTFLANR